MYLTKILARALGFLSDGMALCFKEGLTSGKMLDYIYRNQPSGKGFIGRWIDRKFLNHPGWEAVRIRRKSLEKLLIEAIQERKGSLKLIDIASGPGSYVLSVLKQTQREDLHALCQDLDARWLDEGRAAALQAGLKNVTFQEGNAFDGEALSSYGPHIAVSSGFYDWINDPTEIKNSIQSVHKALLPSGAFILTIQTDHPNLHLAQSVFSDFNKKPLQMTMRSAETTAEWLQTAGFLVEKTLRDPYGYYAVFKARKS
jgi:ubiquinone/menaquinone biosynthesis C-methylase UbiE